MSFDERILYQHVGSRIRAARIAAGLTQRQLADYVGIERTSITNIEAGEQKPPLHVLYRLCIALSVELLKLLPTVGELLTVTDEGALDDLPLEAVPPKTAEVIRALLDDWPEDP